MSTLGGTDHWCIYSTKSEPIFKTKYHSVSRVLRTTTQSVVLLLKQKCGRTLCTPPQCFGGKGGGVQKCETRAKFCEMLGVGGKYFAKFASRAF